MQSYAIYPTVSYPTCSIKQLIEQKQSKCNYIYTIVTCGQARLSGLFFFQDDGSEKKNSRLVCLECIEIISYGSYSFIQTNYGWLML